MFRSPLHLVAVLVAILLGVVSLVVGGRILLGLDQAGYVVVRPVLVFNTVMGAIYIAVALASIRRPHVGRTGALMVALANAAVLLAVVGMRAGGGTVAGETIGAMTFRTLVWAVLARIL